MSRSRELIEKYEKIRKLQAKQEKLARSAVEQAEELDEILAVSRRVHNGEDDEGMPLAPSSRLMGPGPTGRRGGVDPEEAYSRNLERARLASPEAFSRTRSNGAAPTPAAPPKRAKKPAQTKSRPAPAKRPRSALPPMPASDEPTDPNIPAPTADPETTLVARRPAPDPVPASEASEPTSPSFKYPTPDYDALIQRFAADVEVKMGQGRENTFLRKRSEIEKRERTKTMPQPKKTK